MGKETTNMKVERSINLSSLYQYQEYSKYTLPQCLLVRQVMGIYLQKLQFGMEVLSLIPITCKLKKLKKYINKQTNKNQDVSLGQVTSNKSMSS